MKHYVAIAAGIAVVGGIAAAVALNRLAESPAPTGTASSEGPARIGTAPLSHIGVVVRDIDVSTRAWADILGIPGTSVKTVALQLPDRSTTDVRVASFVLPNSEIELMQPVGDRGPVQEHLEKFDHGIYSIGFHVTDGIDELRAGLEARGGRWTAGAPGGEYAFVDFRERLGATVRLSRVTPAHATSVQPAAAGEALGNIPASHVGFAVRSYNEAATALSEILGLPPLPPMVQTTLFPEGHLWNPKAQVNMAMWRGLRRTWGSSSSSRLAARVRGRT